MRSLTNLPVSARFRAHSVDGGTAVPARAGRGRLTALLLLAAATEFLLVGIAAYFGAVLYHRLIVQDSPDPAQYIPESLLISMLQLLVSVGLGQYSRIQECLLTRLSLLHLLLTYLSLSKLRGI
jgi:hypothetical protein